MATHVQDNRKEKSIREAAQHASGKTFLAGAQCFGVRRAGDCATQVMQTVQNNLTLTCVENWGVIAWLIS